jgi:hypothetical protein
MSEQTEMSLEELLKKRTELTEKYKQVLPALLVKLEYEDTLAKIDEARFRRAEANMKLAQLLAPDSQPESQTNSKTETDDNR